MELNISCPNIDDKILGYHLKFVKNLLNKIGNLKNIYVGLKLPPYLELYQIKKFSKSFNKYKNILKFITCCNSVPNGLLLNTEFNKRGAMSGGFNKYISLSNVLEFKKYLDKEIVIIGCGGIKDINDINEYLSVGASFIQLGSIKFKGE